MIQNIYIEVFMLKQSSVWQISEQQRKEYIERLTDELPVLRAKAGMDQVELAEILGVTRQTYNAYERKTRNMSWNIYLALILIFDYNPATSPMIHMAGLLPPQLEDISVVHHEKAEKIKEEFLPEEVRGQLDEQAIHAIETVIMLEYARSNNMSGDAVIRSFNGRSFSDTSMQDIANKKAVKRVRNQGKKKNESKE